MKRIVIEIHSIHSEKVNANVGILPLFTLGFPLFDKETVATFVPSICDHVASAKKQCFGEARLDGRGIGDTSVAEPGLAR
jgi:hypothetical protein